MVEAEVARGLLRAWDADDDDDDEEALLDDLVLLVTFSNVSAGVRLPPVDRGKWVRMLIGSKRPYYMYTTCREA